MTENQFDLIIIGGGPAGYRAAERAAEEGLRTLLFESRALGGVCLNEGCIPSKTLLYSAKLYDYARGGAEKYGVTCENAALDHAAVLRRKQKIVKKLTLGIAAQLKAGKVTVVQEEAEIAGRGDGGYAVSAAGVRYTGARLLLATGSMPTLPPIDGLKDALASGFALTNREILDLAEVPKALVVVGGGVIGLEMASYFASAGSAVTVVEMLQSIGGPIDSEIAEMLCKAYEKKGVKFLLGTTAKQFDNGKVTVSAGDQTESSGLRQGSGEHRAPPGAAQGRGYVEAHRGTRRGGDRRAYADQRAERVRGWGYQRQEHAGAHGLPRGGGRRQPYGGEERRDGLHGRSLCDLHQSRGRGLR